MRNAKGPRQNNLSNVGKLAAGGRSFSPSSAKCQNGNLLKFSPGKGKGRRRHWPETSDGVPAQQGQGAWCEVFRGAHKSQSLSVTLGIPWYTWKINRLHDWLITSSNPSYFALFL